MNKKEKGDLAELIVAGDLIKRGYHVMVPWGDDHRFDLVAYKDGAFIRIQVKYGGQMKDAVKVKARSHTAGRETRYEIGEIDFMAIYHPYTDKCYYVPIEEVHGKACLHLRVAATKNNQSAGIRWAKDYLSI